MAVLACPLQTTLPHSWQEHAAPNSQPAEIRAYKLGKKRWSYNQVELVLAEEGGDRTAAVVQALHVGGAEFHEAHQDSAVAFLLHLNSGAKVQAHVYLCYDRQPADDSDGVPLRGPAPVAGSNHFAWHLVSRKHCSKGCEGRVLRCIQRFGRLGKRCRSESAAVQEAPAPSLAAAADDEPAVPVRPGSSRKDPRYMYLSLDEACTHVDAAAFRLVAGVYNRQGTRLLATAVSPPVRVLANNDVPTGAAKIRLEARLPSSWEGWISPGRGRTAARAAAAPRSRKAARSATNRKPPGKATPPESPAALPTPPPMPPLPSHVQPPPPISPLPSPLQPGTAAGCPPPGRLLSLRRPVRKQEQLRLPQLQAPWQDSCTWLGEPGARPRQPLRVATPEAPRLLDTQATHHSLLVYNSPSSAAETSGGPALGGCIAAQAEPGLEGGFSFEDCSALTAVNLGSPKAESLRAAASRPQHVSQPQLGWLVPGASHAHRDPVVATLVPAADVSARAEAERQLRILRTLKADLQAAVNQAASSGGEEAARWGPGTAWRPATDALNCAAGGSATWGPVHVLQPASSMPAPDPHAGSAFANEWGFLAASPSEQLPPAMLPMEPNLGLPLLGLPPGFVSDGFAEEREQLQAMMLPQHAPSAYELLGEPPLF